MTLLAASSLCLVCLGCVALAAAGLPGIWLMGLAALSMRLWRPELAEWWVIGATLGIALVGEVLEFVAGAAGARKAGGSKRSAMGALVGGVVGALAGTVLIPIPLVGTILGSALGSAAGAVGLELTLPKSPGVARLGAAHHGRIGIAAFVGRLAATLIKVVLAMAAGTMVSAAAVIAALSG